MTDISGASRIPSPSASSTDVVDLLKQNIAKIESGGFKDPYTALGAHNPKMGYAVGKYQVMESNIGPWTKDVFGRPMTTEEFLASPQAQEAVATSKLTEYVGKYGPEGAARAWFGGPGGVDKPNRTDVHGRLNIGQYGQQAMRGIGLGASAPAAPQARAAAPRNIFDGPPAPVQMAQSEPAPTQSFQPVEAQPMAPRLPNPSTPVVPGREPVKPGLLEQLAGPGGGADRLKLAMAMFGDKQQAPQQRAQAPQMGASRPPQGSAQDYVLQYILSRMRG